MYISEANLFSRFAIERKFRLISHQQNTVYKGSFFTQKILLKKAFPPLKGAESRRYSLLSPEHRSVKLSSFFITAVNIPARNEFEPVLYILYELPL